MRSFTSKVNGKVLLHVAVPNAGKMVSANHGMPRKRSGAGGPANTGELMTRHTSGAALQGGAERRRSGQKLRNRSGQVKNYVTELT